MNAVFVDSHYYLALLNQKDLHHKAAATWAASYRGKMFTSEWVLAEVGDALNAPRHRQKFLDLRQMLKSAPGTVIVEACPVDFDASCTLYGERMDKEWSVTDCISFAIMKRLGITEAVTGDHHFRQAGYAALLSV